MPRIKDFSSRVREARKELHAVHEQRSRIVAHDAQLIAESQRKIAASRKLIEEADLLLNKRRGAGKT
jgi:hypothetical protein